MSQNGDKFECFLVSFLNRVLGKSLLSFRETSLTDVYIQVRK